MCDRLAGRYPKDFKFTGWHPHCRCHAEPILKTLEEMDTDTERILDGEEPTPSAEAESYRINCQTCVVANELRRRGFPVEALPNTKGSALEKLSYATQNAWLDADGNIPKKIQCYTLNMDRRGRIVTKEATKWKLLDEATKEPGRYHVDWRWKRKRKGHIVTLERLEDGRIR